MINAFVKRPATTIMFILFFALLGLVAAFSINIEKQPRIDFPLVSVSVTYPGASPEEIEGQVIKDIEDVISEVSEIKKMESRAYDSFGSIVIEFNLGVDVNDKSAEVKEKIDSVINDLPPDIEKPVVEKVDPFATPVVYLAFTSDQHSLVELYEYADKNLTDQFSKITGVGEITIFGGRERQIKVELSPDIMRQKFISIDSVIRQIRERNLDVPAGDIEGKNSTIAVRFEGEFTSIEDIKNLRLTSSDGNQFALKEIANVYDGAAEPEKLANFNGKSVVSLGVVKISDGNDVKVSQGVMETLEEVRPTLEEGMKIQVVNDVSDFIVAETQRTVQGIALGILFTVLVLLFFTGNWKITLISAIVIPTAIVSSLFLVQMNGFTINFMTLLAFATSLGTLVANAIVVIEGIYEKLNEGLDSKEAAITGTQSVFLPVLAAGGTNLVVFAPLSFMDGIVGQFMIQFGLTVIYATIFSLIASFSLTPMLCGLLLRPMKEEDKPNFLVRTSNKFTEFIKKEYKILFNLMFKIPSISIVLSLALFLFGVSVAPYVGGEFIPTSDEDRIEVKFTYPLGTRVENTVESIKGIDKELRQLPGVKNSLIIAGQDGQENARIILNLTSASERKFSDVELIEKMTPILADTPGAEIETIRGDGGGGATADITIDITAPDYERAIKRSEKFLKIMKESGYFRSISSNYKDPKTEVVFTPDTAAIERYGLTNAQVGSVVRSSVYGDDTNIYRENNEQYDIFVETADSYKNSLNALNNVFVISRLGLVPITDLGELKVQPSTPNVYRRDRNKVVQLTGYLSKSTSGVVQAELDKEFNKMEWKKGLSYAYTGNAENQQESTQEMGKAFLLAIIFTYMILAAIMNSFLHPFTISSAILTSFAGVFFMLFFLNSSINIASMLGMVMLVGLAVNNAILMVEEVELLKNKNPDAPLVDVIWQGIDNRFRAILMTSLAIVFGALPQLWSIDAAKVSMGAVIVGGILSSILFTFIITPQTYYYIEKLSQLIKGKPKKSS